MPQQPKTFDVPKRSKKILEFQLADDDTVYKFTPPKTSRLTLDILDSNGDMELAAARSTLDWLGQGLSDEQGDRILGRLRDPDDDLDVDTLNEVIRWLMEQATGRPTKRRSGSS